MQANFYIDVLGDSLGVMTSDGLTEAFSDKPEIAVVDKAREASGLVRDDYFDWAKAASELLAEKDRHDFIVIMLGINDVQALRDGNDALEPFSDRWRERYGQKIEAVVGPLHNAKIPVVWVGLPPMKSERFNAQAIKLNEIYKEHAEKAGAKYVDIWDAFADQSGQFDAFGPNIEGQNVKLRGIDGIHFTKAGARKVAHFLEAEIRKAMDKGRPAGEVASLPPDIEQAADDINAQNRREMGAANVANPPANPSTPAAAAPPLRPAAGPIFSLTAHPVTAGGALVSRSAASPLESAQARRTLRMGEPPEAQPGRADDFPRQPI